MEDFKDAKVLVAELMDDDAIVVRSETLIDRELLDAAVNLRIVGRAGSGLDNIDVPYATRKGVIVCNTPESNVISAAEQIGIEVSETISLESGDYRNLIRMIVTEGEGKEFVIAGTLLERRHPRIVQIGDFPITFIPKGRLLYAPHRNLPGVIGRVGTTMGEFDVNISSMVTSSGMDDGSRDSIMILKVDNEVPQAAIDRCLELDEIYEIKIIDL